MSKETFFYFFGSRNKDNTSDTPFWKGIYIVKHVALVFQTSRAKGIYNFESSRETHIHCESYLSKENSSEGVCLHNYA